MVILILANNVKKLKLTFKNTSMRYKEDQNPSTMAIQVVRNMLLINHHDDNKHDHDLLFCADGKPVGELSTSFCSFLFMPVRPLKLKM